MWISRLASRVLPGYSYLDTWGGDLILLHCDRADALALSRTFPKESHTFV